MEQRKTLDLSFLYNLGSGKAVTDFLSKFKSPQDDACTNGIEEKPGVDNDCPNNIKEKTDKVKDERKEDDKNDADEVQIRVRNNSSKGRFRSMIERRSMWT